MFVKYELLRKWLKMSIKFGSFLAGIFPGNIDIISNIRFESCDNDPMFIYSGNGA